MTFAGAWGRPRSRYTRSVQPGQTGGMNARGSVRPAQNYQGASQASAVRSKPIKYGDPSIFDQYPNSPDPSVFGPRPKSPKAAVKDPSIFAGNKTLSLDAGEPNRQGRYKLPSYVDARYQRNMADLIASLNQQKAQSVLDLENMRGSLRSGRLQADEERAAANDQLYAGLGGGNAGRSGYATSGTEQIQQGYQRGIDELLRQFGPGQQKLVRELMKIAGKQFRQNVISEGQFALDRELAYKLAGQALPAFTPSKSLVLPGQEENAKGLAKQNKKTGEVNKL